MKVKELIEKLKVYRINKMKVKELIEKLKAYDQEMEVIIDPCICEKDIDNYYKPEDILNDEVVIPITICIMEAQEMEETDSDDDIGFNNYGYNSWDNPTRVKKVLCLSSSEFEYGATKDEVIV